MFRQRYIVGKVFEITVSDFVIPQKYLFIGKKKSKNAKFYHVKKEDVRLITLFVTVVYCLVQNSYWIIVSVMQAFVKRMLFACKHFIRSC